MKYEEAYEILENYQFQDWNTLTEDYKKQLDDMKKTCLKALKEEIKNARITKRNI